MTGNETSPILNDRLAYFLQNKLKWKDLNELQKETFPSIINNENILIIAPTAGGKTESALIPIFNQILTHNYKNTSTLYIAPLKALINDMDRRLSKWSENFGLTTMKWHGDVDYNKKKKYLENPTDFLAITPESLEVILVNKKSEEKKRVFSNIKYIIIDEIHYFADSERGIQLNSLLNRITEYMDNPIKIGLSATIGNPEEVRKWIDPETEICNKTEDKNTKYKVLNYDMDNLKLIYEPLKEFKSKKVLIFANSKQNVELYYKILKRNLKLKNIFLHHASISKEVREENEKKFKELDSAYMISTSTLELGIDIGNIDMVCQISPTPSINSLLQRMGRCGRQSKIQRVLLFSKNDLESLTNIAQISLITKNKVENIKIRKKAKDIYLHQILSILFENGQIQTSTLYKQLNKSYVFQDITKEEYIHILKHMKENKLIEKDNKFISLDYEFEKEFGKVNFMNFYAVFPSRADFLVANGKNEIGTLDPVYLSKILETKKETFMLAGKYWKITNIDKERFIVYVKKTGYTPEIPTWSSAGIILNYMISQEIYKVLLNNFDKRLLRYFDEKTSQEIEGWIEYTSGFNLNKTIIPVTEGKTSIKIYTFAGNKVNFLLTNLISLKYEDIKYNKITPIYISFKNENITSTEIINFYNNQNIENNIKLIVEDLIEGFINSKFINYLPEDDQKEVKRELMFDFTNLRELLTISRAEYIENFNLNINGLL